MSRIVVFWIEDNPKGSKIELQSNYFDVIIFQNIVEVKEYLLMFKSIRDSGLDKNIISQLPSAIQI